MHPSVTEAKPSDPALGGSTWNVFEPGSALTAEEYVDSLAVLLQGVLDSNSRQHPEVLIDQLRTTLGLGNQHSSLPMPSAVTRPGKELLMQAGKIGTQLVTWADEALARVVHQPRPLSGPLTVRSHCDGHTLIPSAIHILLGPQGGPTPMMLFNEWIHQMVLLRDALLPFSNWMEVPLPLDRTGLRRLERQREGFLSELLIRQIRHSTIVEFALDVLVPGTTERVDGYGFGYAGGSVLPHVVTAPSVLTNTDLLHWSPAGGTPNGEVETYVPDEANYYEARRTPVEQIEIGDRAVLSVTAARIVTGHSANGARQATIELSLSASETQAETHLATVDLGQALRGHRYAYRTDAISVTSPHGAHQGIARSLSLDPASVLSADGLVWASAGEYAIESQSDGLTALALLGSVYPENVVIRGLDDDGSPAAVGKTGPARFVISLPAVR